MTIKDYITYCLSEVSGVSTKSIEFDIGVDSHSRSSNVLVSDSSENRIKFTVDVSTPNITNKEK